MSGADSHALQQRRFRISGRVQGVFFRASTRQQALLLGLNGYANNLADGSVEVLACGPADKLDQLALWLWQGPSAAKVAKVELLEQREQAEDLHGFLIG